MVINRLPPYNGPIESGYLKEQVRDIIEDIDMPDNIKQRITTLLTTAIDLQSIPLIGYVYINIMNKPLEVSQFNEMLLDYLLNSTNEKTIMCKVIDNDHTRAIALLPSNLPLPDNLMLETHANIFGNDIVEVSLRYDYIHNEYHYVRPLKEYMVS